MSGSAWFLAARRRDGAVRLVDSLHGEQALRQRQPPDLGLELRRDARPLPRDARRIARLSPRSHRASTTSSAGGSTRRSRPFIFLGVALVLDPGRPRVDPQLGLPARDAAASDADRRQRRRGTASSTARSRRTRSTGSRSSASSAPRASDDERPARAGDRVAAEVAAIVDSYEIDRILIASSVGSHEETLDLVRTVHRPDVHVSIVPRYFEIFTSYATLDDVEGMPVVTLPPIRLGRSARALKRTVDVVVSAHRAARPRAAARRGRGRDQARQQGHGALPAAAPRPARTRPSTSSSSGRCPSAPRRGGPRCCT